MRPVAGYSQARLIQIMTDWGQTEYKLTAKAEEVKMASVSPLHAQECARCGSKLIVPEWDERVNAREVQYLWRCLNCRNEFVTLVASDGEPFSVTEITKPFFTSLVVE
jgi:DNA-directed RNA polymerase subunit RPC12/RpoP